MDYIAMLMQTGITLLGVAVLYLFSAGVVLPYFVVRKQKQMGLTKEDIENAMETKATKIIADTMVTVEAKIKENIPNIGEIIATVKTDIKEELKGVIVQIKAELPDIDAKIEELKAEFSLDAVFEPMITELSKPPTEWDERYFTVMTNVSNTVVSNIVWMIDNDEKFNKWFYDKMRGLTMNMKKEFRTEIEEMIPTVAKSIGIDPAMLDMGADVFESIPEEYRGWAKLAMMFMKGGIPGMGGGGQPALPDYGGF